MTFALLSIADTAAGPLVRYRARGRRQRVRTVMWRPFPVAVQSLTSIRPQLTAVWNTSRSQLKVLQDRHLPLHTAVQLKIRLYDRLLSQRAPYSVLDYRQPPSIVELFEQAITIHFINTKLWFFTTTTLTSSSYVLFCMRSKPMLELMTILEFFVYLYVVLTWV